MKSTFPRRFWLQTSRALLLLVLLLQVACTTIRLISPYDETIDRGTGDVHTKIVAFVGRMTLLAGKPEGTYEANKAFYPEIAGEITTLKLRADATPKNEITVKLFEELEGNTERLRKLHETGKEGGLSLPLAKPALAAITTNCGAILRLEIAKKRGEKD